MLTLFVIGYFVYLIGGIFVICELFSKYLENYCWECLSFLASMIWGILPFTLFLDYQRNM